MLRLLHRSSTTGKDKVVWRCQFHTSFVADDTLYLLKKELDDATGVRALQALARVADRVTGQTVSGERRDDLLLHERA